MSRFSKVSWQEGMFLLPQHFQQADRHYTAALDLRLRAQRPYAWGILGLQMNEDALARGILELTTCQAILADGTPVDIPGADRPPPARSFQMDVTKGGLDIYLTLPRPRSGLPLVTDNQKRADIRYLDSREEVGDDLEPDQRQQIEVAEKNLRLVLGGEPLDGTESLKIAQVQRNADGTHSLRQTYVPPCPTLGAATALLGVSRELLGMIVTRASSLAGQRVDEGSEDVMQFLFLQTLNQHAVVLRQLHETPGIHPVQLYLELCRLCGALASFEPKHNLALELLLYDHHDIAGCFDGVDRLLKTLLSRLFTTKYEIMPLLREEEYWKGFIADQQIRLHGRLFLSVTGLPENQVSNFPKACKIAEYARIDTVMRSFSTEVTLNYAPGTPTGAPRIADASYFEIDRQSRGFDQILRTGQIAVFVASAMPVGTLKLIGLRAERPA